MEIKSYWKTVNTELVVQAKPGIGKTGLLNIGVGVASIPQSVTDIEKELPPDEQELVNKFMDKEIDVDEYTNSLTTLLKAKQTKTEAEYRQQYAKEEAIAIYDFLQEHLTEETWERFVNLAVVQQP